jgi:serine acetyltransferase
MGRRRGGFYKVNGLFQNVILWMNRLRLIKTPVLGERIFIDPTAVVLGDVTIGDDSSVWPMAVIRGDVHTIQIGKRMACFRTLSSG